jgi:hypothetical protein
MKKNKPKTPTQSKQSEAEKDKRWSGSNSDLYCPKCKAHHSPGEECGKPKTSECEHGWVEGHDRCLYCGLQIPHSICTKDQPSDSLLDMFSAFCFLDEDNCRELAQAVREFIADGFLDIRLYRFKDDGYKDVYVKLAEAKSALGIGGTE